MAGGLAALLDDVAMIAKLTSATSTKAMAVVIDDAAVTPRYVTGLSPTQELRCYFGTDTNFSAIGHSAKRG